MIIVSPDPVKDAIKALVDTGSVHETVRGTREAIADLLAVSAALPESPPRPDPVPRTKLPKSGIIPQDPVKAAEWGEQWRTKHAPQHASFISPYTKCKEELNPAHHSVQTVLALERQINGGRQLSAVKPKETP